MEEIVIIFKTCVRILFKHMNDTFYRETKSKMKFDISIYTKKLSNSCLYNTQKLLNFKSYNLINIILMIRAFLACKVRIIFYFSFLLVYLPGFLKIKKNCIYPALPG